MTDSDRQVDSKTLVPRACARHLKGRNVGRGSGTALARIAQQRGRPSMLLRLIGHSTLWVTIAIAAGCARDGNFSQTPGFADYERRHPAAALPADETQRELLRRHQPRLWLPSGNEGPISFYDDFVASGTLVDGAGSAQIEPVTRASLNRLKADPRAVFSHRPVPGSKNTSVVLGRFDVDEVDLGSFGTQRLTFLSYHYVFRHSGLVADLPAWQDKLLALIGNPDDWHQLDHYTAATLVLDSDEKPLALMLQQHNFLRSWVLGVDLQLPQDGRPVLDVAIRSNELYPHRSGRNQHRAVQFATPTALLYLLGAGPQPTRLGVALVGNDVTEPSREVDCELRFLPPDDAFYRFQGYLGERRLAPGRDGPPGADFNVWPTIKPRGLQLAASYWRPGNQSDAATVRRYYQAEADLLSYARVQAEALGAALAAARSGLPRSNDAAGR